jgi:hypothetical protein
VLRFFFPVARAIVKVFFLSRIITEDERGSVTLNNRQKYSQWNNITNFSLEEYIQGCPFSKKSHGHGFGGKGGGGAKGVILVDYAMW